MLMHSVPESSSALPISILNLKVLEAHESGITSNPKVGETEFDKRKFSLLIACSGQSHWFARVVTPHGLAGWSQSTAGSDIGYLSRLSLGRGL